MNIAFDVKGTLDGYKKVEIRYTLKKLYDAGHKIYIWSSLFSYANEMAKSLQMRGIECEALEKYAKNEADAWDRPMMDLAFEDDRTQSWLAAKRIVFVDEVPNGAREFVKELIESLKTA